ncbi:MAG: hypothetical protein JSU04_13470 [Bdellovibrionales bacterium]|nr:hypothetical protein [Bdellovibrionales bacterium]
MLVRSFLYKKAARSIRKKGVLAYLRALQVLRKSLAGSVLLFVFLQLMVVGFIGSIVVGVFLIPQDLEVRLWILLGVFGVFFLLPFVILLFIFSERVWYRLSGAEKMVAELRE